MFSIFLPTVVLTLKYYATRSIQKEGSSECSSQETEVNSEKESTAQKRG